MSSIEFVTERIKNSLADISLQEDTKFYEIKFNDYVQTMTKEQFRKGFINNKCKFILNCKTKVNGEDVTGNLVVNIQYDDNADFEYFTTERCVCDGTLMFMDELVEKVLMKVLHCQTVNKEKVSSGFNSNPFNYEIFYTVGNFVHCEEYGDFGTNENPWMKSRFTVMLPIKFDIKEK